MFGIPISVIIAIPIVLLVIIFMLSGYVKAPPDIAYIISGFRKDPRILIGRAGVKIPFFERKDNLLVKQISIDLRPMDLYQQKTSSV